MHMLICLLTAWVLLAAPGAAAPAAWPTNRPAPVVRHFDPPPQPWRPGHRGVDLLVLPGQAVHAPMAGTVVLAAVVVDRPVVVVVAGDYRFSFEPVTATVPAGTRVAAGELIGVVANGYQHCPPRSCLHWGLRIEGIYHDPLLLVRRYRPVLLPDA